MIIPQCEEILIHAYRCPICGRHYLGQTGNVGVSCLVNHPPGDCCHYGEQMVTQEQIDEALKILQGCIK